ncbi:MAG TPA: phosphatase PAP2 family protein [Caulobacteraceae bacterium]|jgi:undecaprenyl-diphosphatase|nr:phosphatase PAP2 family protein [Caulobacteraceae bacterium]
MARQTEIAAGPLWRGCIRLLKGTQPLALLLGLSGVLLFAMLTEEMREGETRRFDTAILVGLRHAGDLATPLGPAWLPQTAVDISALGGFTVLWILSLAIVGYLLLTRRPVDALLIAGSIGGGSLLNTALKLGLGRDRPEVVPHLVQVHNASFPSGHAMLSAVAYLTIGAMLARAETSSRVRAYLLSTAVILVVLIGLSRLYLGVHWPTDVVGGWCLGSAWALGVVALARRLRGPRSPPAAAPPVGEE